VTVSRLIATLAAAGARPLAATVGRSDVRERAWRAVGKISAHLRTGLESGGAAWLSTLSAPDVKPDIEPQAAVHPRATTFY